MIQTAVTVNTVQFEAAMQRLRAGVRAGIIDPAYGTLTVQGRLLAERCQAITPPRSLAQGRKAVARDINRAFQPIRPVDFTSKSIKKIIRKDDRPAWEVVARNFKQRYIKGSKAVGFDASYHKSQRDKRGRVRRNRGVVTLGPQATAVRRYIREIQKRVGWAKGGWNHGILALGGRIKDAWVARHSVTRGIFVDGRQSPDPFIRVGNDTGWGMNRSEGDKVVRTAIGYRARDMQRYFEVQMKLAAAKAQSSLPLAT